MMKGLVGAYFQLVGDKQNKQRNQALNLYVAQLVGACFLKQETRRRKTQ
ncbi:hypothetical protein NLY43_18945 [Mesorhizobium sp. C416B]|nr:MULTISPECIES: hypothetical protein [unclassified Mesorhizobium]WJI60699.1 hypothetical protein NLY43_18945 [Mesorhizobium sp. C416B]